jgi:hypothetical protein
MLAIPTLNSERGTNPLVVAKSFPELQDKWVQAMPPTPVAVSLEQFRKQLFTEDFNFMDELIISGGSQITQTKPWQPYSHKLDPGLLDFIDKIGAYRPSHVRQLELSSQSYIGAIQSQLIMMLVEDSEKALSVVQVSHSNSLVADSFTVYQTTEARTAHPASL